MIHTDLREILSFSETEITPYGVMEKKNSNDVIFFIGEEGENITMAGKPKRVILPLVHYGSEEAIQERIAALLLAVVQNTPKASEIPYGKSASDAARSLANRASGQIAILAPVGTEKELEEALPEIVIYKTPLDVGPNVIGFPIPAGNLICQNGATGIGISSDGVLGVGYLSAVPG